MVAGTRVAMVPSGEKECVGAGVGSVTGTVISVGRGETTCVGWVAWVVNSVTIVARSVGRVAGSVVYST